MASNSNNKKGARSRGSYFRAQIATNVGTCAFCRHSVDDEIMYGKLYAIGDIQCHYFCAILSCCLLQKGSDEEGLFGFLYPDIIAEVERCKKHKCSYCNKEGANMGCSVSQCRKQFHLPCGRQKNAVSLFYGNYKSYCENHAPKQKVSESVAANVKLRIARERRLKKSKGEQTADVVPTSDNEERQSIMETVCAICYDPVEGYPCTQTFWPVCCARDAWFHRSCLQRMALTSGMHYLKCPLCNNVEEFRVAVMSQGYYVPDRDAAWELEQNAFAEIYERAATCSATTCLCTSGRDHDDYGLWDLKLCVLCGSVAIHAGCRDKDDSSTEYICSICRPAAPAADSADLQKLLTKLKSVQLEEQRTETLRNRRVMPSRMSLARTKPGYNPNRPSSSRQMTQTQNTIQNQDNKTNTELSRSELNLAKPKRASLTTISPRLSHNVLLSPTKMVELGIGDKIAVLDSDAVSVDSLQLMRRTWEKLRTPAPLAVKKRIVQNLIEELYKNLRKDTNVKTLAAPELNSPKMMCDVTAEDKKDVAEELQHTPTEPTEDANKCIKNPDSPSQIKLLFKNNDSDNFKCGFRHKHAPTTVKSEPKLQSAIDFAMDASKNQKNNEKNLKRHLSDNIAEEIEKKRRKLHKDNGLDSVIEERKVENVSDNDKEVEQNEVLEMKPKRAVKKKKNTRLKIKILKAKSANKASEISQVEEADSVKGNRAIAEEKETKIEFDVVEKERKRHNISLRRKCDKKSSDEHKESTKDKKSSDENKELAKTDPVNNSGEVKDLKPNAERVKTDRRNKYRKVANRNSNVDKKVDSSKVLKSKNDNNSKNTKDSRKVKSKKKVLKIGMKENRKVLKVRYKKENKNLSLRDTNFKVKIQWKKQQLNLRITEKKKLRKKYPKTKTPSPKVLKQYILSPNSLITKPETDIDITPTKKKCVKTEKKSDNFVQTSISSFFKISPRGTE